MPRVLAQHDIRRTELLEHSQRDVVEVPDRRRADGERHLSERVEADEPRADQPRGRAELSAHDAQAFAGAGKALTRDDLARGIENEVAGGREATADDDEIRIEDVHEAPDARAETAADS